MPVEHNLYAMESQTIDIDFLMIAIPFIVAILGASFPFLLQAVGRIDEKYSSTRIVEAFHAETKSVWFKRLLKIAVYVCFLSAIIELALKYFNIYCNFITISVICLSLFSAISVIILLFLYYDLITDYSIPLKLYKKLDGNYNSLLNSIKDIKESRCKFIQKRREKRNENKIKNRISSFNAMSELMYYSIKMQDEELQKEVYGFMASYVFNQQREKENLFVEFDDAFYAMLYGSTELISSLPQRTVSYSNGNTLLTLFFDSNFGSLISEKSYSAIWRTLRQQLRFDKDDFIISYWTYAHQYPQYYLQKIYPNSKYENEQIVITNKEEVDFRNQVRRRFFEFHYVLGALILHLKKYKLLKDIVEYTNAQPAKYILVPSSISEVMCRSIEYTENIFDIVHFERLYPFPNLSGVNQNGVIISCVQKYLAVLFLRQYLIPDMYGKKHLSLPNPPESLTEMNKWKETLEALRFQIKKVLEDTELLVALEFPMINHDWFEQHNFEQPNTLIDKMIEQIEIAYHDKKENQEIDPDKEKDFLEKTGIIIVNAIESIKNLFIKSRAQQFISFPLQLNTYQIMEKNAFSKEQDKGYINHDSVVAQGVAMNYKYQTTYPFNRFVKKNILLAQKDIFAGISRLNLDASKHVIICCGVNLDYYRNVLGNYAISKNENGEYRFKTISIINIEYNMPGVDPDTIYVLEKQNLPTIKFEEPHNDYKLDEIVAEYHIKAGIIPLNENKEILKEIEKTTPVNNLEESVLVCVEIEPTMTWNQDTKMICIRAYMQFRDNILPESLENIKSFDAMT